MMADHTRKILLVEPRPEMLEKLVPPLARRMDAHITCVADASSCLDVEMREPHDVVVTALALSDLGGVELARRLTALADRPVILLADDPSRDQVIDAIRLGAFDVFVTPVNAEQFAETVIRAVRSVESRRRHAAKYRRMRDLVRRVIHERRDLTRRLDLICRDLVGAQRRLVHRVLALEEAKGPQRP